MKLINTFMVRVRYSFLYGRYFEIYMFISFGIYALSGYTLSISKYGNGYVKRFIVVYCCAAVVVSLYLKFLSMIFRDIPKKYFFIIKPKQLPSSLIFLIVFVGYLLYFEFCENRDYYLIPVICTYIHILIKKLTLKAIPSGGVIQFLKGLVVKIVK